MALSSGVVADPLDEGPIDLERVHGEPLEVAEGGVAGAEVVHGELDPELSERVQLGQRRGRVLHDHALGDLELQAGRVEPALAQGLGDLVDQVGPMQLARGEIHADDERRLARMLPLPGPRAAARLREHPLADGHDQPGLLGQTNEVLGGQQPSVAMLPADERLDLGDPPGLEDHHRLVVDPELLPRHRAPEIDLQVKPLQRGRIHVLVEHLVARLPPGLGLVQGHVGIAQDVLGSGLARAAELDPDTGRDEHLAAVEGERSLELAGDPFGHGRRGAHVVDILQEDAELVAAEPRERVLWPEAGLQAPADLDEEPIDRGCR
jgi:hypothetical protein